MATNEIQELRNAKAGSAAAPGSTARMACMRDSVHSCIKTVGNPENSKASPTQRTTLRPMTEKLLLKTLPIWNFSGRVNVAEVMMRPLFHRRILSSDRSSKFAKIGERRLAHLQMLRCIVSVGPRTAGCMGAKR